MTPTTYGRDFAYCLKSHGGVRGFNASLWRFLLRCTLFCHSVATFLTSVSSYEGGCGFEDVIKYLSTKGMLSVDAQGYLREVRGENVFAVDWPEKEEALKYIHILKANEHETEVLTGCKNPREAALKLANWGVKEVLLTLGSMGSVIYADGEFHEIPAYPPTEIVDATGCGDTYMAGYLYMRNKGASYKEAGCFAAAMCTIKLEASGPFGGTEKDVWDIIERYK